MKYLLLIYDEEKSLDKMPEAEMRQMLSDYGQFTQGIQARGATFGRRLGCNRRQPRPVSGYETANEWSPMDHSRKRANNSAATT